MITFGCDELQPVSVYARQVEASLTMMQMQQSNGWGNAMWVEWYLLFWALRAAAKTASRLRCIESAIWGS